MARAASPSSRAAALRLAANGLRAALKFVPASVSAPWNRSLSLVVFKAQVLCSSPLVQQAALASCHYVGPTLPSSGLAFGQPLKANVRPLRMRSLEGSC